MNLPTFPLIANAPNAAVPTAVAQLTDNEKKRQDIAKALMAYGSDMPDQGMVGRVAKPISPFETLSKLGASGIGAYMAGKK